MAATSAKRWQRQKRPGLLAALAVVVVTAVAGCWVWAGVLLLLLYLVNELLLSDHVFYSPRVDYRYRLSGTRLAHNWHGDQLQLAEAQRQACGDTLLMEVRVSASMAGRWFDPRVRITAGEYNSQQYLERGVGGRRYLNLSAVAGALVAGRPVTLQGEHCRLVTGDSVLWSYDNSGLVDDGVLVLAPHADDAEIAAFGLYSRADSCTLVTVTAGETETEQFASWCDDDSSASRFKGEVRSLDSVAAGIWGGVGQEQCINLGYGCLQLQAMCEQPDQGLASPWSGLDDSRSFRRFNRFELPSDVDGRTSWNKLVADLAAILRAQKPRVLVSPHPLLDTHSDHRYASLALWQAWQATDLPAPRWLLYANHLDASQDFPFGPAHSSAGLPPALVDEIPVQGLYNVELDGDTRRRKALALDLMHDLKRPLRWKKWWRKRLQKLLLGRPLSPYGEDDFFRKGIRRCELFIVADHAQMAELLERLD